MAQKIPKMVSKTSYTLDTPYTAGNITWPPVSYQDQIAILDQLCSLLHPVGEHRSKYIHSSSGKRDRKRKRDAMRKREAGGELTVTATTHEQHPSGPAPSPPEITTFLSIGFNSTERLLEAAAQRATPMAISNWVASAASQADLKPLVAVFVDRSELSPLLYSHLPQLLSTASLNAPSDPAIRLVTLPNGSTARLSAAFNIPRASVLGLERDAPNTQPLVEFIREHVAPVEIPWLENAKAGTYMPVAIKSVTTASPSKVEKPCPQPGQPQTKKQQRKAQNTQQSLQHDGV